MDFLAGVFFCGYKFGQVILNGFLPIAISGRGANIRKPTALAGDEQKFESVLSRWPLRKAPRRKKMDVPAPSIFLVRVSFSHCRSRLLSAPFPHLTDPLRFDFYTPRAFQTPRLPTLESSSSYRIPCHDAKLPVIR
jgi:hypothetical protein